MGFLGYSFSSLYFYYECVKRVFVVVREKVDGVMCIDLEGCLIYIVKFKDKSSSIRNMIRFLFKEYIFVCLCRVLI